MLVRADGWSVELFVCARRDFVCDRPLLAA
jgi:hypothetical protein